MVEDFEAFKYEAGIRLEAVRLLLERTPAQMCELMGIARSVYSAYARGVKLVAPEALAPLIPLGITSDYVYYGVKACIPSGSLPTLDEKWKIAAEARTQPPSRGRGHKKP
ncbi:hypothetical protein [Azospirillum argentinense]